MGDIAFHVTINETDTEWIVSCSSARGSPRHRVPIPYERETLARRLTELETNVLRSAANVVVRGGVATMEGPARELGMQLTNSLFQGDLRVVYDRCRSAAQSSGGQVCVTLDLDGPTVSQLPWEFLRDPFNDDYLALRAALTRHPQLPDPVPPLLVEPPLRILGVVSSPSNRPRLDTEREQRTLEEAIAPLGRERVELTWLPRASGVHLSDTVGGQPWHVLHFIGHGGLDDTGSGYIELLDNAGNSDPMYGPDLGRLLDANSALRLVVLNACASGQADLSGMVSSLAAQLMAEGLPAVVAMQYEISDPAALTFSRSFYEGIAKERSLDRAMTDARISVKLTHKSLEWATPVLFRRSDEANIFRVRQDAEPTHLRTAPAPVPVEQPVVPRHEVAPPRPVSPPPASPPIEPTPAPHAPQTHPRSGHDVVPVGSIDVPAKVLQMGVRADGQAVAVTGADGITRIFRLADGRELARCRLPQADEALGLAWTPYVGYLVTAHRTGRVVLWDVGREVPQLIHEAAGVRRASSVAVTQDGRFIAFGGDDGTVRIINANGRELRRISMPVVSSTGVGPGKGKRGVRTVLFGVDDKNIFVGCYDGRICSFDVRGQLLHLWPHPGPVSSLSLARTRGLVVSGCMDGCARVWQPDGALRARIDHGAPVNDVAFVRAGALLITGGADGSSRLWNVSEQCVAELHHDGPVVAVADVPGTDEFVTATATGSVQVWRVRVPERQEEGQP